MEDDCDEEAFSDDAMRRRLKEAEVDAAGNEDKAEEAGAQKSSQPDESGIDRLGSADLMDNLGNFLLFTVVMVIVVLSVLLLALIFRRNERMK